MLVASGWPRRDANGLKRKSSNLPRHQLPVIFKNSFNLTELVNSRGRGCSLTGLLSIQHQTLVVFSPRTNRGALWSRSDTGRRKRRPDLFVLVKLELNTIITISDLR